MQQPKEHKTEIAISARFEEKEFFGAYIRELKLSLTTRDSQRHQTTITNRLTTCDTTVDNVRALNVEIQPPQMPHGDDIYSQSHFNDKYTYF
jgi:hypothetical protein